MTIEFRCTQCDKLLRVPAGNEGKKAKCPQCGNVLNIPDLAAAAVLPETTYHAPPPPPPRQPSDNPFQSPAAAEMRAGAEGEIRKGFHPTRIDLGETLGTAWQLYKANFGKIVLGGLAVVIVITPIVAAMPLITRGLPWFVRSPIALALNLIPVWLLLGFMQFMLRIARGENASFDVLFSGGRYMLSAIGAYVLMSIAILVGFLLLIVPGIIVALMLSQTFWVLVDQNVGALDSLRMSAQATRGNKLTLLALGLVTMVIVSLVTLFTCLIGYFFMVPFAVTVHVTAYLAMTGQGVAVRR